MVLVYAKCPVRSSLCFRFLPFPSLFFCSQGSRPVFCSLLWTFVLPHRTPLPPMMVSQNLLVGTPCMTRLFNNSNLTHCYPMQLHISNIYQLTYRIINSRYQKIKEWVQAMNHFKETNNMSQWNSGESYRWVRKEDIAIERKYISSRHRSL